MEISHGFRDNWKGGSLSPAIHNAAYASSRNTQANPLTIEMTTFIEIPRDGNFSKTFKHHDLTDEVCRMMTASYAVTGYVEPWIGYLIEEDGKTVGTCAFKSPPVDGKVEIAYFTFPEFERRGIGRLAAAKLVELALRTDPSLQVVAQTLPHENASTSILRSLGFKLQGAVDHPEDGTVWDWALEPSGTR